MHLFAQAFKFPDVMDLTIECNVELCKTECSPCSDPDQVTRVTYITHHTSIFLSYADHGVWIRYHLWNGCQAGGCQLITTSKG